MRLAWVRDGKRMTKTRDALDRDRPGRRVDAQRQGGCAIGVVRLAQFSSGAHAEVYKAIRRLQKRGAKAFVLDLRGNGGGLVNEAQLVASAFLPTARS